MTRNRHVRTNTAIVVQRIVRHLSRGELVLLNLLHVVFSSIYDAFLIVLSIPTTYLASYMRLHSTRIKSSLSLNTAINMVSFKSEYFLSFRYILSIISVLFFYIPLIYGARLTLYLFISSSISYILCQYPTSTRPCSTSSLFCFSSMIGTLFVCVSAPPIILPWRFRVNVPIQRRSFSNPLRDASKSSPKSFR